MSEPDRLDDFTPMAPDPGAFPGQPRRIGIVVEDVDGQVFAIECTNITGAGMRVTYPLTERIPMNLRGHEFAEALAAAMSLEQRVTLEFNAGRWTWRRA